MPPSTEVAPRTAACPARSANARAPALAHRVLRWAISLVLLLVTACGGGKPQPPVAIPVYTPEDAALFNDLFRPELFGYPAIAPPEADTLLPDRVVRASAVVPVRVVTVTLERGSHARESYSVVVAPTEASLAGEPLTTPLTLRVAANSPIFGWVADAARQFVGTRLLLFVRHYQDGPHFHGSLDTPAVREAVLRARIPPRRVSK